MIDIKEVIDELKDLAIEKTGDDPTIDFVLIIINTADNFDCQVRTTLNKDQQKAVFKDMINNLTDSKVN